MALCETHERDAHGGDCPLHVARPSAPEDVAFDSRDERLGHGTSGDRVEVPVQEDAGATAFASGDAGDDVGATVDRLL